MAFSVQLYNRKSTQVNYVYFHRRCRKDLMSSILKGTAGIFMEPEKELLKPSFLIFVCVYFCFLRNDANLNAPTYKIGVNSHEISTQRGFTHSFNWSFLTKYVLKVVASKFGVCLSTIDNHNNHNEFPLANSRRSLPSKFTMIILH